MLNMFPAVFKQDGNIVKIFHLADLAKKTALGKMMNPAGVIARGAISGIDTLLVDIVLNVEKHIGCVMKFKPGTDKGRTFLIWCGRPI